jgi:outer membrane protein assembly factor BamB
MISLGEGYAAAAVRDGCVYVLDHLGEADVMRCFSLDDGRDIWRNSYPVVVPSSHGRSRTIPTLVGDCVLSLGPQCHVTCWDAGTGNARWLLDLVADCGATVPPWYAGQCPLVDTQADRLILAPGGKALVMAVDYHTGKVIWESPNPRHWAMTHVSIVPMEFAGRRMYVYCGKGGVAGVDAESGRSLWDTTDWQIGVATCPSPVVVGDGRIFFCGGYNAGSLMLQLRQEGERIVAHTLLRLSAKQFSSEQQTPVFWKGHLYGVRQKDKQLVCLDLDGRELWNSGSDKFGEQGGAPYMIADGLIFALTDEGLLRLAQATPDRYQRLAEAQVFEQGTDSWGPMALVAGRLIARDFTRMACLDVAEH